MSVNAAVLRKNVRGTYFRLVTLGGLLSPNDKRRFVKLCGEATQTNTDDELTEAVESL